MRTPHGERSVEAVVALSQSEAVLRLTDLADACRAPLTSMQRAVESLVRSGLVTSGRRRHQLVREHPAATALVEFSLRSLPVDTALEIVLRANRAVEFAGVDRVGYFAVESPFAESADQAVLRRAVQIINRDRSDARSVEIVQRAELRDRIIDTPELRARGLAMREVKGSAVRAFRDPRGRGSFKAPRLGRLHDALPHVSQRAMHQLADRYGVARLMAFGSAVRSDFRPDSDVDVLVEPQADRRFGLREIVGLRRDLETLFEHDVDVVVRRAARPSILRRATSEGVVLYGRA